MNKLNSSNDLYYQLDMRLVWAIIFVLFIGFYSSETFALELKGDFKQGALIFGKIDKPGTIIYEGQTLRTDLNGNFVFGFGRDHTLKTSLEIYYANNEKEHIPIRLEKRTYEIQHISGLPDNMVTPPDDFLDRIIAERNLVNKARAHDTNEPLFLAEFEWPAIGPISGVYGSQRVLNGVPKQPHFGVDIAAAKGEAVIAPSDGIVTLAETDLYYTGGTIILDHGFGLTSTLMHLSEVSVTVGQRVKRGDKIGKVGMTGRATGPHLDWRMNWFKHRVDPQTLSLPPIKEQK